MSKLKITTVVIISLLYAIFIPNSLAQDQNDITALVNNPKFWQLSPEQFLREYRAFGFYYATPAHDEVICQNTALHLLGNKAFHVAVTFANNRAKVISIVYFQRRLTAHMSMKKFSETEFNLIQSLSGYAGKPLNGKTQPANGKNLTWANRLFSFKLESRVSQTSPKDFNPEFLSVSISPTNLNAFNQKEMMPKPPPFINPLLKNIKHKKDGSTYVYVKLQSQGKKYFSSTATISTVLSYLGPKATQAAILKACGSIYCSTPSANSMRKILLKIQKTVHIPVKCIDNVLLTNKQIKKLILLYNKQAKLAKKEPIEVPTATEMKKQLDISSIMLKMDINILKKVRCTKISLAKFSKKIMQHINAGVPIIWCVNLGIVTEKQKIIKINGPHARLIIGFNAKKSEIIYADSWGKAHIYKKMPVKDALAITTAMYVIYPNKILADKISNHRAKIGVRPPQGIPSQLKGRR